MPGNIKRPDFRSPKIPGYFVIAVFAAIILTAGFNAVLSVLILLVPDTSIELENGNSVDAVLLFAGVGEMLMIFLRVLCVIFYLIWLYRAFRNLAALRARNLNFTPGWAVGWSFIPFANLVMPFQAVQELYLKSNREEKSVPESTELIGFWWGTFIAGNVFFRISAWLSSDTLKFSSKYSPIFYLLGSLFIGAAAILAILVIKKINSWQLQSFATASMTGADLPPPPPVFENEATHDPNSNLSR